MSGRSSGEGDSPAGNWFRAARKFEWEPFPHVFDFCQVWRKQILMRNSQWKLILTTMMRRMQKKSRVYAAECRRLARTASQHDRAVLTEIADAWITCAEQAERDARRNRGR
jgi:hypothetical protein